jgi:hypothetical protein
VGTRFDEMNHEMGRSQTTKGVWLAKAAKPEGVPTLVMDLEAGAYPHTLFGST